jgi:hypothetical protein
MAQETSTPLSVLTAEEVASFRRDGYVRLRAAFPAERARALVDAIWEELRTEHGIDRDDRTTWRTPPCSPRRAKELWNEELATARFQGAISDLLGRDDWPRPRGWGGYLVTFPAEPGTVWDVPTDLWHWDGPHGGEGLLIFSHYAEVRPRAGGTLLLSGSHRLVRAFYDSLSPEDLARPHRDHRRMLVQWEPRIGALMGKPHEGEPPVADRVATFMEREAEVRGVPTRVVELTGAPGDVVFCDLGMLHAVATNVSDEVRIMRAKFLKLP